MRRKLNEFEDFTNCHFQQEFLHRYCTCINAVVKEISVISTVFDNTNGLRKYTKAYFFVIRSTRKDLTTKNVLGNFLGL